MTAGLLLLAWAGVRANGQLQAPELSRRVLILYSDERLLPANVILDQGIQRGFAAESKFHIEFHSEFLDLVRFPNEGQLQRDFLREKYRKHPPDLVIAVGGGAFHFLMEHPDELFGGVPLVYCSVAGDPHPDHHLNANFADVPVPDTAALTLEMMLRLHPDTRYVAVVSGNGLRDVQYADGFRGELATFGNRVTFIWLTNLSIDDLRGKLAHLPDHSLVLYLTMFQDASGRTFTPREALEGFAPASRAPIYGFYETYVGHGIVGGSIVPFEEIGRKAAKLSTRVLAGEDGQSVSRLESYQPVAIFDWRELRRWKISEKSLPPGSIVQFRKGTFWDDHKGIALTSFALFLLETTLILALLAQLRRRRLAESTLAENERRLTLTADAANVGVWIRDLMGQQIWATEKWRELFGFEKTERLELETILERIHSEDRDAVRSALAKASAGDGNYQLEFRVALPNGKMHWINSRGRVEFNLARKPNLVRGISLDITKQKKSEEEVRELRQQIAHVGRVSMMGQLASALAHEINQPLAAILRNAEAAELFMQNGSPDLNEIRAILADIRNDDQRAGTVIDQMRGLLKRHKLDTNPIDVCEVVSEVIILAMPDARARDVKLEARVPVELPPVRGNRIHIQQVLLNLILNGLDALNGVGGRERRVSVIAEFDGAETIEFAVSDTGEGIPPDKLSHVFDPFFTTKANGLGMGLPISRTIIEAHSGKFWAVNNQDGGASFRFTLPVAGERVTE